MSLERITSKKISTVIKIQQRESEIAEILLEISQVTINSSSFIFIERNASISSFTFNRAQGCSEGHMSILLLL